MSTDPQPLTADVIATRSEPTHWQGYASCGHEHPSEAEARACITATLDAERGVRLGEAQPDDWQDGHLALAERMHEALVAPVNAEPLDVERLAALILEHATHQWPAQLRAISNGGGWTYEAHLARFLVMALQPPAPDGGSSSVTEPECDGLCGISHGSHQYASQPDEVQKETL